MEVKHTDKEPEISVDINEEIKPENSLSNSEKKDILCDLNDSQKVDQLENIPAYLRKKIVLEDKNYSSSSNQSNYTVSDKGNGVQLKENNPYLHDNVD